MSFGRLGSLCAGFGKFGSTPRQNIPPPPPEGFVYLLGADGAYLKGADGAYLYGAA